jgi:hypothetical protein
MGSFVIFAPNFFCGGAYVKNRQETLERQYLGKRGQL